MALYVFRDITNQTEIHVGAQNHEEAIFIFGSKQNLTLKVANDNDVVSYQLREARSGQFGMQQIIPICVVS